MKHPLNQVWELESIFPGGSDSPAFNDFLAKAENDLDGLYAMIRDALPPESAEGTEPLARIVESLQLILVRLREAESFVGCLQAQNQSDRKAVALEARVKTLASSYLSAVNYLEQLIAQIKQDVFDALLDQEAFRPVAFALLEKRQHALEKLSANTEAVINDLAVDGYHGWGAHYDTIVEKINIPYEQDGNTVYLSAGQAANKLSDPNRDVRVRVFADWEKSWAEPSELFADTLNRLAGFRLQVYKHRGWEEVLKEPLMVNRMTKETLFTMWDVIERNKAPFVEYLKRKEKLLGLDALSWHDVDAPIGKTERTIPYDEAADIIVKQFRKFSPRMAEFAEMALSNNWIEAEDRPAKRPGGFCTSFPVKGQTRIFMTYHGTAGNLSTLAHELGHAYHQEVMKDMPGLAQEYAMNVAETASTFAEMIVSDALISEAADRDERIYWLEDKIQRSVAFYMNIHARFLFETSFYAARKQGLLDAEQLNELMLNAQRTAYRDALSEYSPHFWASKLHFYLTDVPFYNFPYTFGYMFSSGIYAQAKGEGPAFEDRYAALLRDTASMTVEELASKHLGVDLTKPEFWQQAMDASIDDVREFMSLTN